MKLDFKKIFTAFLVVALVVSVFLLVRLNNKYKDVDTYKTYVDELVKQKDSVITVNLNQIRALKVHVADLKIENILFTNRLDSLNKVKQQIKIVYKKRYEKINSFESEEVEAFWKNKFD